MREQRGLRVREIASYEILREKSEIESEPSLSRDALPVVPLLLLVSFSAACVGLIYDKQVNRSSKPFLVFFQKTMKNNLSRNLLPYSERAVNQFVAIDNNKCCGSKLGIFFTKLGLIFTINYPFLLKSTLL
jgi:hypothetical protein